MPRARKVVTAHVWRQGDVYVGAGPDQVRRHSQAPEFGGAKGLKDLRTGFCLATAVQHTCPRPAARAVGVIAPPEGGLAAHLPRGARRGETNVERQLPSGDVVVGAVPHDVAGFILIEAEVDEGL